MSVHGLSARTDTVYLPTLTTTANFWCCYHPPHISPYPPCPPSFSSSQLLFSLYYTWRPPTYPICFFIFLDSRDPTVCPSSTWPFKSSHVSLPSSFFSSLLSCTFNHFCPQASPSSPSLDLSAAHTSPHANLFTVYGSLPLPSSWFCPPLPHTHSLHLSTPSPAFLLSLTITFSFFFFPIFSYLVCFFHPLYISFPIVLTGIPAALSYQSGGIYHAYNILDSHLSLSFGIVEAHLLSPLLVLLLSLRFNLFSVCSHRHVAYS